jgi:hypothetical protein
MIYTDPAAASVIDARGGRHIPQLLLTVTWVIIAQ